MFNSGKTSFPHVSEFNKLLYLLLINIFVNIFSLVTCIFSGHINVVFRIISFAYLICFILFFLLREGASSLAITSSYVFSAHSLRSDIAILVFCTLCVEVQGEFAGLCMKFFSLLFSGIEHDIELIVSMNDINSFMYNLRGRHKLVHRHVILIRSTIFNQAIRYQM